MNRLFAICLLAAGLGRGTKAAAQQDPGRDAFLSWAKRALSPLAGVAPSPSRTDLAALGRMIGNASIVALSEGVHAGAEPLEFRNRVLQYLVERLGFTAIAIESGIVEGRTVHDYVLGGPGDLAAVLAKGISWTFDRLPQNEDLVRWIRDYNADPKHTRKVHFYGFDIPGSPGNPMANRGLRTGLDEALLYLGTVDATAAADFHARLDRLLPNVSLDPRSADGPQYSRLSQPERDQMTAAIADLVALYERREAATAPQARRPTTSGRTAARSARAPPMNGSGRCRLGGNRRAG
ncbi:MAG: erythromycin esterase family protein [Gemmatimonadota bacterium]